MESVLKNASRLKQGIEATQALAIDPFTFFLDKVIIIVASVFLPTPLLREIVLFFRKPITILLASTFFLLFMCLLLGIVILASPLTVFKTIFGTTLGNVLSFPSATAVPIASLSGYIEEGFVDTDTPTKDPLGGGGETNSMVTAGFHDPSYYQEFGMVHEGVDLVPSAAYFATNKAYQLTNQVIVFATNNGTATTYLDPEGALTVEDENSKGTTKTVYKHFQQFLVNNGETVRAGQPVGVMGATGEATGPHVHYEVRLNEGDKLY